MAPVVVFHPPGPDYDPTCTPQRYKPCASQILDERIGAGRPGMSPNAVVCLVFFFTLGVWIGCYFFFMWWIGHDIENIRRIVEEERGNGGGMNVKLMRVDGEDKGKGKADG